MPSSPPVYLPNLLQIKPQYADASGRVHENVTWWVGSVTAGYTGPQLTYIGGIFATDMANAWAKIGATNAQITGCIIQDFTSATGQQGTVAGVASGILSTPAPVNTSVLVSLKGANRYKGGHSRWYLPSLGETITTDGVNVNTALGGWTTFLTDLNGLFTDMAGITAGNGGPVNPVILHKKQHNNTTTPPTPIAPYTEAVLSHVASTKLATQRRRLRKAPHH